MLYTRLSITEKNLQENSLITKEDEVTYSETQIFDVDETLEMIKWEQSKHYIQNNELPEKQTTENKFSCCKYGT